MAGSKCCDDETVARVGAMPVQRRVGVRVGAWLYGYVAEVASYWTMDLDLN